MQSSLPDTTLSQGEYLRRIRLKHHLSQRQLGSLLKLPRETYRHYERDDHPVPEELWSDLIRVFPETEETVLSLRLSTLPLSSAEKDLLLSFRRLDEEGKKQILTMLRIEESLSGSSIL